MPEGDTIFRAARTLHRALAGHVVTGFESTFPALNRVAVDRPIVGRSIESVRSLGKHLLMTLTGDLILQLVLAWLNGLTQANAVAAIQTAGLVPVVIQVPSSQPKGTVIAQDPPRDQKVQHGAKVRINVSAATSTSTTTFTVLTVTTTRTATTRVTTTTPGP